MHYYTYDKQKILLMDCVILMVFVAPNTGGNV